jgi:hypothetical protein
MATKKRKRFNEGGITEAEDKARGLEASKSEKVGFLERMRMGNIDEEGSEAYRRFGAGRGKAERTPVEDRVATPVTRPMPAAQATPVATEMDDMEAANARPPIPVSAGPKVEQPKPGGRTRVDVQSSKPSAPAKSSSKMQEQSYRRTGGASAEELANYKPPAKNPNYSNEGRGREMTKKQQAEYELDSIRPTSEQTQKGLETAATMMGGAGLKGVSALAKKLAGSGKKTEAGSRALAEKYDDVTFLGRGARRSMSPNESLRGSKARELEAPRKSIRGPEPKKLGRKKEDEFASGGSVFNPSKRADGAAIKGKTRCKMR